METLKFTYKKPRLYKDPTGTKWCIRYSVKFDGQTQSIPVKEYGQDYLPPNHIPLNKITDTKKKEYEFELVRATIENQLKKGIFQKQPETAKVIIDKQVKEANKNTFDYCLHFYLQQKGYINPKPKKKQSAQTIGIFFRNQFRPFLEKNNLLNDVRDIQKIHLLNFVNYYYLHSDPKIKWSNNTFNNKRSFLGSFFSLLLDEEIIEVNPVLKLKGKKPQKTERFGIFTKEERDILFAHLEKKNYLLHVVAKLIYYSYIRASEAARLKVSDFDLVARRIFIDYDAAKGQKDTLHRYVLIVKSLQSTLIEYLSKYEHEPNWFMFGKEKRPSVNELGKGWYESFTDEVVALRVVHPKLFNRDNLTLYACKHSGVTHFIEDNKKKFSTMELLQFVQKQCRHEDFADTQKYWKQLGFELDDVDAFMDL